MAKSRKACPCGIRFATECLAQLEKMQGFSSTVLLLRPGSWDVLGLTISILDTATMLDVRKEVMNRL